MNTPKISNNQVLSEQQIAGVSGGGPLEDGKTFGGVIGWFYWGARDYLSETVFPYWLD
jgi:hypothetical protein